jgi:hypothetical protein
MPIPSRSHLLIWSSKSSFSKLPVEPKKNRKVFIGLKLGQLKGGIGQIKRDKRKRIIPFREKIMTTKV